MSFQRGGCTVFVGNIDFDVPEDKLVEELNSVGKVVTFRLVIDRATGKSKGYGFCTYESPAIADLAVQSLRIVLNGRSVKINYAESDPATPAETETLDVNAIVSVVEKMDVDSVKEVIHHMKSMAINRPERLKTILNDNPSLVCALFHVFLKLGLVEREALEELLAKSFSINTHKSQILRRILQYHDYELEKFPPDVRQKMERIRERLLKG